MRPRRPSGKTARSHASAASIATYHGAVVEVRLLGGLEAEARGRPLPLPAHPQGPVLLAWLALHPGEHPRGALAALLWPDLPESNARTALRSAVWALRRSLGPDEREVLDGRATIGLRCTTEGSFRSCVLGRFQAGEHVTIFFVKPRTGLINRITVATVID